MKLIHVYIAAHKSVRNLNISLAGHIKCSVKNRHLTINKRRDTSDYYNGYHCSSVIGPNGVGKSSILDFIESAYFLTDSSGLLVFFCEDEKKIYGCTINFVLEESTKKIEIIENYEGFAQQHQIRLIKINNISDVQSRLGYEKKLRHPLIENRSLENYTRLKPNRKKYFDNLLRYFKWSTTPEKLIEGVGFEFNFHNATEKLEKYLLVSLFDSEHQEIYKKLHRDAEKIFRTSNKSLDQYLIYLNISPLLIDISGELDGELKKYAPTFLHYYFIASLRRNKSIISSLRSAIEALRYPENWAIFQSTEVKEAYQNFNIDIYHLHETLNYSESLFADISNHLENGKARENEKGELSFLIDEFYLVSEITSLANSFSRGILSNISWGWRGVSTGEMAKSHILSETYDCLKQASVKNSIIVIDEADLYLHPEWQRDFLDSYLALLAEINYERFIKKPQLIITTHSPIIISDFLPQDIVSLIKGKDGEVKTIESLGFGTNITNLFIDGMHIESTFGEHSRKAIARLMNKSEKGTLTNEDRILIKEIGNKYVREFLLKND
jgi:predicted ATP-dependent endonuclease of OLD family